MALAEPVWAQELPLVLPPVNESSVVSRAAKTAATSDVEVPVLQRLVKAGTVLTAEDVAMQAMPANRMFAGTARSLDEVVGQQLTRTMDAGRTLNRMQLKDAAAVARDSAVTLTFRKPGLALVSQAKALQEGRTGESIRVLNVETRTTLLATVTGPGTVEIR